METGFSKTDKYIMRWRGDFKAAAFVASDCLMAGKMPWPCLDGTYKFKMTSVDGSRLYLDDTLVIDNDGHHSARTKTGVINLGEGWHKFAVVFFEDGAGARLQVATAAPDTDWQRLWVDMTRPLYRCVSN